MKHYKVRCYRTDVETDYTSGSVFIEIYAEGNNTKQALLDAMDRWEQHYAVPFDIFDYVGITYAWSDENAD